MAWITPRTWTTSEVVTASMMNSIRDNLNELWKGVAAGDLQYYSSDNTQTRLPIGAEGTVLTVRSGLPVWENSYYVYLARSTSQPIPNNTVTYIDKFDIEHVDTGGFHNGTDNYVTIPISGLYAVWAWAYFTGHVASAGTLRQLSLYINEAVFTSQSATQPSSGNQAVHIALPQICYMSAGTVVKLAALQISGTTLDLNSINFTAARIR